MYIQKGPEQNFGEIGDLMECISQKNKLSLHPSQVVFHHRMVS